MPKTISRVCPSGCSDRVSHSEGAGCSVWRSRAGFFCGSRSLVSLQGCRGKRPGGSVYCILPYLFYYYVQRFFYTKKLNAVLINSVCRWIGAVPKVTILCRISTNLFYFLKICWDDRFFVSTVKLYSLTRGRLSKHLSNFHAIYFLFLSFFFFFFAKRWVVFVWNLRHCSIWCFCLNQSSLPWRLSLDVTTLHLRSRRMTHKSYSTLTKTSRFPVETVQLMFTKCSPFSLVRRGPQYPEALSLCLLSVERGGEFWTEDSASLKNGT